MSKKEKSLMVRMDTELRNQLQRYANRNDEGVASMSARRAIKLFLKEQDNK